MTYNVKSAVKAALILCSFVAVAGCEVPNKTKTAAASAPCNCDTAPALRQAVEGDNYVQPRRTTKRAVTTRRASGGNSAAYASGSYSSSSYAESEYYSSSYSSSSSVTASSSSSHYASGYGAKGSSQGSTGSSGGWVDGYGKRYANGQSYGGYYQDGGPGAAYIDVITDDRQRGRPWANYNFRTGLSNGY